jgi:hypothetical protein
MVRKVLKATKIGPRLPAGPLPAPDPPDSCAPHLLDGDGGDVHDLNRAYAKFINRAERELISLLAWPEAEVRRATGRASRPPVVWRSAIGPVATRDAYSTVASRAWRQAAQWGQELVHALRADAAAPSRTVSPHGKSALFQLDHTETGGDGDSRGCL